MLCAHALDWGYSPLYCTSTEKDSKMCPELGCHEFVPAGLPHSSFLRLSPPQLQHRPQKR